MGKERRKEKEQKKRGARIIRWRHTDEDLYHQCEEAEERADKWEITVKDERKQHEWAISNIRAELRQEMTQMRRELEGLIEGIMQ